MPKTIFEIFNKEGKVTRRGYVKESGLNIDIRDEDYRYVVRDELDKGLIYSQGFLKKDSLSEKDVPLDRPVTVVRQLDGKMDIFINSFVHGHTELMYISKDAGIEDAIRINKQKISLSIPEGKYSFYTKSDSDKSNVVEIVVSNNASLEILENARLNLDPFEQGHQDAYEKIKEKVVEKQKDVLLASQEVYFEYEQEKEKQLCTFDFIMEIEKIINEKNQFNNEKAGEVSQILRDPQERIVVPSGVDKIIVYEVKNDKEFFLYSINSRDNKEHMLPLKQNAFHKIELFEDSVLTNTFFVFSPDNKIKRTLWEREIEAGKVHEEVNKRNFLLYNHLTDVKEEHKSLMAIEEYKKPLHDIISFLDAKIHEEKLEIFINEYEALEKTNKNLYLSIKEEQYMFHPNRLKKIPIENAYEEIDLFDCALLPNRKYFLWIEDQNKRILSNMALVSTNTNDAYEYSTIKKEIQIKLYKDRLLGYLMNKFENIHDAIETEIHQLLPSENVFSQNIYKHLIARLSKEKDKRMFNKVSEEILKEKFQNVLVDENFFSVPVEYFEKKKQIIFPEATFGYIIQVDRFNVGDESPTTEYFDAEEERAIDLSKSDYCILSAIDKETYIRSGFVFLNSFYYNAIISSFKVGIEVK